MKDSWKYVSIGDCIKIIIVSAIFLGVLMIPFSFGTADGLVFTYTKLGIIGDGSISQPLNQTVDYLTAIIPLSDSIVNLLQTLYSVVTHGYFIVLAADVLFALILIITRNRIIREIFRILSIFAAIFMIITCLLCLAYIGLRFYAVIKNELKFMDFVYSGGLTTFGAMFVLSFILIFKQFKWFKRPFDNYDKETKK